MQSWRPFYKADFPSWVTLVVALAFPAFKVRQAYQKRQPSIVGRLHDAHKPMFLNAKSGVDIPIIIRPRKRCQYELRLHIDEKIRSAGSTSRIISEVSRNPFGKIWAEAKPNRAQIFGLTSTNTDDPSQWRLLPQEPNFIRIYFPENNLRARPTINMTLKVRCSEEFRGTLRLQGTRIHHVDGSTVRSSVLARIPVRLRKPIELPSMQSTSR